MNNLEQKIKIAVNNMAKKIYYYSQDNVPVRSGSLKYSGSISYHSNSTDISYGNESVKHASVVEFGIERNIPITGTQITSDGKRYENKRVVYIEGVGFRVIHEIKARPGKFFLTNAVYRSIEEFKEDLARELGGKVTK